MFPDSTRTSSTRPLSNSKASIPIPGPVGWSIRIDQMPSRQQSIVLSEWPNLIKDAIFKAESHQEAMKSFAMATKSRTSQVAISSMDIWLAKLGHIHKEALKYVPQAVEGVALGTHDFERKSELCPECQLGQAHHQISRVPTWRGTYPQLATTLPESGQGLTITVNEVDLDEEDVEPLPITGDIATSVPVSIQAEVEPPTQGLLLTPQSSPERATAGEMQVEPPDVLRPPNQAALHQASSHPQTNMSGTEAPRKEGTTDAEVLQNLRTSSGRNIKLSQRDQDAIETLKPR
ncbi:hypothetical protein FOVSG1_006496 [Fusarium oxysporum f. sp. vasinfectum]